MNNKTEIPFQIQSLIASLADKDERRNIRENYRYRLACIHTEIDKALKKYDSDMQIFSGGQNQKK